LLHIKTTKGKGYKLAEQYPYRFHGVEPFNIDDGQPKHKSKGETYSKVFGNTLIDLATENDNIVAITAAMPSGTGLYDFSLKFPNRLFDVGIAESHAVTFASGLAKSGFIPIVAIYSTFLQRAYDQILHDVCIQNLHVIFCIDRAGIVGGDGETHQGMFDISYLSHIPNMTFLAPKNKTEFIDMLKFATNFNSPIAIRYPRGVVSNILGDTSTDIILSKCEYISKGIDIAILSIGAMFDNCYEVFLKLQEDNFNPTLINCRFITPIDNDMINDLKNYKYVFVVEENVSVGGFASHILSELNKNNIHVSCFYSFALPMSFIEQGEREQLLKKHFLDVDSIYDKIKSLIN
jgi:1-deoxy-D-xylulose-5-phosphate synthase